MRALIDADRYPYSLGNATDEEGDPLPWPLVSARLDSIIQQICEAVGATSHQLYITSDDKSNFRYRLSTIRPYKGNRTAPKYFWYEQLRRHLVERLGAIVVHDMEADDALGIEQCSNYSYGYWEDKKDQLEEPNWHTIICSVDKDLNNIPGWHYDELKEKTYWVSEEDSLRNFYCQLLTGDPVDNIAGLYGVGKSSILLKHIMAAQSECDMYSLVKEQYEKRFGSYWKMFLWENASLLWIKRTNESQGEKEVQERLERLDKSLEVV